MGRPSLWTRLQSLWHWNRRESDLDEEMAFHLSEEADDRVAAGLSTEHARVAAKSDFGNVTAIKEATREMWGWGSSERLVQDVRYGLRTLRRNPGYAVVAILTLGLGVGATTAVFGVLDAVVARDDDHRRSAGTGSPRGSGGSDASVTL